MATSLRGSSSGLFRAGLRVSAGMLSSFPGAEHVGGESARVGAAAGTCGEGSAIGGAASDGFEGNQGGDGGAYVVGIA